MQEWTREDVFEQKEKSDMIFLYLYTPLCGTCQLAGRMLEVVAELIHREKWGKCNLNYIPELAAEWKIESVPCLIVLHNKKVQERIYAFHSVPYIYETVIKISKSNLA